MSRDKGGLGALAGKKEGHWDLGESGVVGH